MGTKHTTKAPAWWKNTYFIFGFLLLLVAILGFIRGARYIMDPGQPYADALPWYYVFAALIFFVNGYVSHKTYVREYHALLQEEESNAEVSRDG